LPSRAPSIGLWTSIVSVDATRLPSMKWLPEITTCPQRTSGIVKAPGPL